jgi:2-keto-4-pentenoate hydratase/2-oxohepta-3-ene-1,7-dioic acid hydratase in catechol pathway
MRLHRVALSKAGKVHWAYHEDGAFHLIATPSGLGPFSGSPLKKAGETWAEKKAHLFAPVAPTKIICAGRNYRAHADELNNVVPDEPLIFLKAPSAIVGPHAAIIRPRQSSRVDHEGELAVVVGRTLKNATEAEAQDAIFGYTCANDVTARDIQKREGKFTRAKGFDTFCPLGPALVTADEIPDPHSLSIVVRVNDEIRQQGNTAQMVFSIPGLLSFISQTMTLFPSDVVLTGTPAGVGPLVGGDRVSVDISGIGALENPVQDG